MPKVSIVLPNYNYARYLDERIQSLLNQTYSDFELIILDDASTDNSIEVIEKYTGDTRVKTKFYSENSGLTYKRWNDGADLAQGEYLLIAGADDSCHPTLLEKLVKKLDAHPSVGLAFSQSLEVDSNGTLIGSMIRMTDGFIENKERWRTDFVEQGKIELKNLLLVNTIPNASCVLMRRDIFFRVGKFDEKFRLSADWVLWGKMLTISDIAFISEPLNYFRTHSQSVGSRVKVEIAIKENCLAIEMIHQNLNDFFQNSGCLERVDLANHLWYRRAKYYLNRTWNIEEAISISFLILRWNFYTWQKRIYFLIRFWLKSASFLVSSTGSPEEIVP
jgi:glycosyltransferase involved in cell wall biosynthesis